MTTDWQCERGFRQSGDSCVRIEIPRNGYLDTFGRDWKCERGFKKVDRDCVSVNLPTNAHLDYSGNDWSCDRPFRRQNDSCVLWQGGADRRPRLRGTDRPCGKKATMDMDRFLNNQKLERLTIFE